MDGNPRRTAIYAETIELAREIAGIGHDLAMSQGDDDDQLSKRARQLSTRAKQILAVIDAVPNLGRDRTPSKMVVTELRKFVKGCRHAIRHLNRYGTEINAVTWRYADLPEELGYLFKIIDDMSQQVADVVQLLALRTIDPDRCSKIVQAIDELESGADTIKDRVADHLIALCREGRITDVELRKVEECVGELEKLTDHLQKVADAVQTLSHRGS